MAAEYYTVLTKGPIVGLNITGPVDKPVPMYFYDVLKMVKSGYVVYKHNPGNFKEKVRVTTSNISSIEFKTSRGSALAGRLEAKESAKKVKTSSKSKSHDSKGKESNKKESVVVVSEMLTEPDEFTEN